MPFPNLPRLRGLVETPKQRCRRLEQSLGTVKLDQDAFVQNSHLVEVQDGAELVGDSDDRPVAEVRAYHLVDGLAGLFIKTRRAEGQACIV